MGQQEDPSNLLDDYCHAWLHPKSPMEMVFPQWQGWKPMVNFKSTSTCGHVVDPGLQHWLDTFYRGMVHEAMMARKRAQWRKSEVSNMNFLVRWGIQLLRSSPWKVCWTDKTASYALLDRSLETIVHHEITSKAMYIPVVQDDYMVDGLTKKYFYLAKAIENLEQNSRLGTQLRRPVNLLGAKLVSTLSFTVKTHKDPGEVAVRNLHCSRNYSFKDIGLWLQHQLAQKLDELSHLVKNPLEVKLALKEANINLHSEIYMYKFDIKEFFLSGTIQELKQDVMKIFQGDNAEKVRIIAESLDLLLSSQFVYSKVTDQCLRVCEGSGMGLPQSGGIADAAFYTKTELEMLQPERRRKAGILAYLRFKDDGLIISENRVECLDWFQMFKAKAGYFRVICEQVARFAPEETQEVKFLQFRILLCADTRTVRVVPHSKSVAIPLSPLSAHPPSTENWPLAHLRCMCRLASDEKAAEETKQEILTRFLQSSAPQELIQRMSAIPAWRSPQNKRKNQNGLRKTWWLPMPWHPVWKFAKFGKVIRDMSSPDRLVLLQRAFGIADPAQVPEVRLAWRNRLQHSGQVFQRLWNGWLVGEWWWTQHHQQQKYQQGLMSKDVSFWEMCHLKWCRLCSFAAVHSYLTNVFHLAGRVPPLVFVSRVVRTSKPCPGSKARALFTFCHLKNGGRKQTRNTKHKRKWWRA